MTTDIIGCKKRYEIMNRPAYIILFKGDDSDFQGNQSVDVVIDTELDTTGMKAHFRFMDFVQDFDSIPENKTLSLVFPKAKTSEFPLGAADATLRFEDSSGKFRTISNRIHIVVTNSVHEAYDNEDSQSITVTVKGTVTWEMIEGKPTFAPVATSGSYNDLTDKPTIPDPVTIDAAFSETSENPVQNKVVTKALYTGFTEWVCEEISSGWTFVKCDWRSSQTPAGWYADVVADDDPVTLSVPLPGGIDDVSIETEQGSIVAAKLTRHLVTPTKTSQLVNDGAPNGGGTPYATTAQIPTVPSAYTSTPAMDGAGSAGSSTAWARGDHVHPSDTSRAAKTDLPYPFVGATVAQGPWAFSDGLQHTLEWIPSADEETFPLGGYWEYNNALAELEDASAGSDATSLVIITDSSAEPIETVTATRSNVLTVSPRTVATYTATSTQASFSIAVGAGITGAARDCVLVVDCTAADAVAPTVTWPSNFHPRTDAATDLAIVEAGKRAVFYISEYATDEFVVGGWQETTGGNA